MNNSKLIELKNQIQDYKNESIRLGNEATILLTKSGLLMEVHMQLTDLVKELEDE